MARELITGSLNRARNRRILVQGSKPAIQLDKEPAIMVREPDATRQPTPHDILSEPQCVYCLGRLLLAGAVADGVIIPQETI
jgi:hypothetical protein